VSIFVGLAMDHGTVDGDVNGLEARRNSSEGTVVLFLRFIFGSFAILVCAHHLGLV
jgi:hypothetical protein